MFHQQAPGNEEEAAAVVRNCPLFSHLPRDKLTEASQSFSLLNFTAGSPLMSAGSVSPGLFIVIRGVANVRPLQISIPPDNTNLFSIPSPPAIADSSQSTCKLASRINLGEAYGSPLKPDLNPLTEVDANPSKGPVLGANRTPPLGISLDDDLGSAAAVAEDAREADSHPKAEASLKLGVCLPYSVKPGDWFGHPPSSSAPPTCHADITAQSDLLCAVLLQDTPTVVNSSTRSSFTSMEDGQHTLLSTTSIPPPKPIRLVPSPEALGRLLEGKLEEILDLHTLTDRPDSFQGVSPPEMFEYPRIFGGQLVGQSLMAATRTVDPALLVHSLHCYFIRPGHNGHPVEYRVERIRDGAAFSARRVKAYQGSREIFLFTASFHRPEPGYSFRVQFPRGIRPPEELPMVEEEEWRLRTTSALPMAMRRRLARHTIRPMPADLRHCESVERLAIAQILRDYPKPSVQKKDEGKGARMGNEGLNTMQGLNVWMRARGLSPRSTDLRLHRCVIAYLSDFVLLGTSLAPHGLFPANPRRLNMASLDHAMWFHEECRADEWLLYSLHSPWSGHARGMSFGRFFTRDGTLAVSTAQEGLIRPLPQPGNTSAKL